MNTKVTECNNCGYETKCTEYEMEGIKAFICDVCLKSNACKALFYHSCHLEDGGILQMMAWGINYLRDKVAK